MTQYRAGQPHGGLEFGQIHFFFDELLFGRCVNAEPAAVFAALLDLGSLRTLDAALAARLLVTSLLVGFLAIFDCSLVFARHPLAQF